jgi:hypothetical protein
MELLNKTVEEELITKKLAALAGTGMSQRDMAKECNITPYQVKRIMNSDHFKELVTKIGDTYLEDAKNKWNVGVSKLMDKCLTVLRNRLDNNDLEAVKVAIKSIGIGNETQSTGDTNLTVVLPSTKEENEIPITYTVDDSK